MSSSSADRPEPDAAQPLENCLCAVVEGAAYRGAIPLGDALRQLDTAARDEATGLDPRLRHYLERRSYVKALEELRSTPNG